MGARTQIWPLQRGSSVQCCILGLDSHGKKGNVQTGRQWEAAVGRGVDIGIGEGKGDK